MASDEIKEGDIILFYSKGFYGWLVNKFTKGKYGHSEIMIANNFGLRTYTRGITIRFIDVRKKGEEFDVYRPLYPSKKNVDEMISYVYKIIQKTPRYGFLNLMAFAFIRVLRKLKIRWFEGDRFLTCSELCADCLVAGSVKKLEDIPSSLISPNDLPRVFGLEKI